MDYVRLESQSRNPSFLQAQQTPVKNSWLFQDHILIPKLSCVPPLHQLPLHPPQLGELPRSAQPGAGSQVSRAKRSFSPKFVSVFVTPIVSS